MSLNQKINIIIQRKEYNKGYSISQRLRLISPDFWVKYGYNTVLGPNFLII